MANIYRTPIDTLAVYPHYDSWFGRDVWSLGEIAALTIGVDPGMLLEESDSAYHAELKVYSEVELELINGDLDTYSMWFGDIWENLNERIKFLNNAFCASDFILPVMRSKMGFDPWHAIQWCFDNVLPFHFMLADYLKAKGFGFRFSQKSAMLADYAVYAKKEQWTLSHAAELIVGAAPGVERQYLECRKNYYRYNDPNYTETKYAEVYQVLELAEESYNCGRLEFIDGLQDIYPDNLGMRNPQECMVQVRPRPFLQWALDKKFHPPEQLLELFGLINESKLENISSVEPNYATPFMNIMKDAVNHFSISFENQPGTKELIPWFEAKLTALGEKGPNNKAKMMATFVRLPELQRGGNFKSRKVTKGS